MMKRIYLALSFVVAGLMTSFAQNTGSIQGKIVDKSTGEPLPFANVVAEINGRQSGGAQTDFDGKFTIKPLSPGKYDIKASFVGYTGGEITGVVVNADKITFIDVKLNKGAIDIKAVEVTAYSVPLIDKGQTSTQSTVTAEQIVAAPSRDVKNIAATTAGIVQNDDGDDLNVRGSRSNATDYIVDGVRIRGSVKLAQKSIDQITVKTGGLEAQYGDNTGGVIVVSTKGPAEEFTAGVEYTTSEVLDKYGYNLIGVNFSGPIMTGSTETGGKRTILGFLLGGEYQKEKDSDPSAVGSYKLKDDVLSSVAASPLQIASNGTSFEARGLTITSADIESVKAKNNNPLKSYRFYGKLDFAPSKNVNITIGGNYDKTDRNLFSWNNELFNSAANENRIETNINGYIRFTQKFSSNLSKEKSSTVLSNAYYSIQFDYSRFNQIRQDSRHEDRLFDYGYIGKFTQIRNPRFALDTNGIWQQTQLVDSLYLFQPANLNLGYQAYTTYLYQHFNEIKGRNVQTYSDVDGNLGSTNGGRGIGNIHGIWTGYGGVFNLYQKTNQDQYTAKILASADLKNHNIMVGFEYEQRIEKSFAISPRRMWQRMRDLANLNLDLSGSTFLSNDTNYWAATYTGNASQPGFYENVRAKLGLSNTQYVDIDNYERSNFSLDLFTPDELSDEGTWPNYLYYGYTYDGQKQSGNPTFKSFFTDTLANGNHTRNIGAFRPIYMAGYIQDKFAINDLIFNIGLRVDRFDANQKVLNDPYSLYPVKTVGQLKANGLKAPATVGDDAVPYVLDINNPDINSIIGYRLGDQWYDEKGNVLSDPGVLAELNGTTAVYPYLADTKFAQSNAVGQSFFDPDQSFKDYDPQWSFMPRVAFSFPISDEAQFFAHYDILTQRPPARLRVDPSNYLYWEAFQDPTFSNPNLQPEKTTDYELGFKQKLSNSSAMSISAFYRELRNMIQEIKVAYAYPRTYTMYGNIDFGTVKGLIFSYDLRRTGNVKMNLSYTLQFADGTGSGDAVADKLLTNGLPNLKSLTPLDYDQRHVLVAGLDYSYGSGKDYNGPMVFGKPIFSNTGMYLEFKVNSGTPYSADRDIVVQAGNLGLNQSGAGVLLGSINGARLPWQYRVSLKLNKGFDVKMGSGENSKSLAFNVYFRVQNLLNTKNVIGVYRATGSPDDDGYVASPVGQQQVNTLPAAQQQAYVDQYAIKVVNPDNYSLPRRMFLGLTVDF